MVGKKRMWWFILLGIPTAYLVSVQFFPQFMIVGIHLKH
jgi:hypothetical protein